MASIFPKNQLTIDEEKKGNYCGTKKQPTPLWPNNGRKMLNELRKKAKLGYPVIGGLRGLAEFWGLKMGIRKNIW